MSIVDEQYNFSDKQGQYLAFIYYYTKVNRVPPAQRDIQKFFGVSPPTVHQMIVTLEKKGLITRVPDKPRSLSINIPENRVPILR